MGRTPSLDYGALMDQALRTVIARIVAQVAEHGLPDGHSLYITFPSGEAEMPEWLRQEHPESLSIVLQHEYDNLAADGEQFTVDLSFRNRPARLQVPFRAITVFADPQAQFGLRFRGEAGADGAAEAGEGVEEEAPPGNGLDSGGLDSGGLDSGESNVIPFHTTRR